MISKRCQGANLFNHLKQKFDCSINYEQIIDSDSVNNQYWVATLTFNNKVYEVMENASEDIYKIVKVKD